MNLRVKCKNCGTAQPLGSDWTSICHHCGQTVGAKETAEGGTPPETLTDQLHAHLANIADHLFHTNENIEKMALAAAARIPADQSFADSVTVPAGGPDVFMDLGTPSQGRIWQVRRIVVGGVSAVASAAGVAYFYTQGSEPFDLNLLNLVDFTTEAFPQRALYSTHQVTVLPGEHLWVVIVGGTAGQQYAANAKVEDWALGDLETTDVEG